MVEAPGGVTVLDDCYNANPASMRAALETAARRSPGEGRAVAVLGDMLELGPGELEEHAALGARGRGSGASWSAFFGPRERAGPRRGGRRATRVGALRPRSSRCRRGCAPELRQGDVVLVKGSRGMRLERVVDALTGVAVRGHWRQPH